MTPTPDDLRHAQAFLGALRHARPSTARAIDAALWAVQMCAAAQADQPRPRVSAAGLRAMRADVPATVRGDFGPTEHVGRIQDTALATLRLGLAPNHRGPHDRTAN